MWKLIKLFNHFLNHSVNAEIEADTLYNLMAYKSDTKRVLEVFEALEKRVKIELLKEEKKISDLSRLINSKYPVKAKFYDPIFDKTIEEFEVEFETVKAR